MSDAPVVRLERHVLGSGPALVDSGKDTFGWTPALAGERAARLKSEVPWGIPTARMPDPPRLEGDPASVLGRRNLERLRFAVLPLEQRMGFCMWGAVGDRTPERAAWRVITHTVLVDGAAFRALAGNPFALLELPESRAWLADLLRPGAFDERRELSPITLRATPETAWKAESLRRREMELLRGRLAELMGRDDLARWLAAIYAALSAASAVPVALTTSDDHRYELLIRLAWLSLPLRDRLVVSFSTEQGASAARLPRLAALDPAEWRGRAPDHALQLTAEKLASLKPTQGQVAWAEDVVEGRPRDVPGKKLRAHGRAHSRAAAAGVRMLADDGASLLYRYAALRAAVLAGSGERAESVIGELAKEQRDRLLSRAGFAGFLLGAAARRVSGGPLTAARRVLDAIAGTPAAEPGEGAPREVHPRMVRAAVRALAHPRHAPAVPGAGNDPLAAAGILRSLSVADGMVAPDALAALAPGGSEAGAGAAAVRHVEGAEALLNALARLNGGGGRFQSLSDAAVQAVASDRTRLEALLADLPFSAGAATWGVSLYRAAAAAGVLPTREALLNLFEHRLNPSVHAFLGEEGNLRTLLRTASEGTVRTFVTALEPGAAALAGALLGEVTGTSAPAGAGEAVFYLAGSDERAAEALDTWAAANADVARLLALYLQDRWGGTAERRRMEAAGKLLSRPPGDSPLASTLVFRFLDHLAAASVLRESDTRLVEHALTHLYASAVLVELPAATWKALLAKGDAAVLARLNTVVEALSHGAGPRTREALDALSRILLVRSLATGDTVLLKRQLAALPPAQHAERWRAVMHDVPASTLGSMTVASVFLPALQRGGSTEPSPRTPVQTRALAELAANVFLAVVGEGPRELRNDDTHALLRLGWEALEELRMRLPPLVANDPGRTLPVLFQLMIQPAPFELLLVLENSVQPAAGNDGSLWYLCQRFEEALEKCSPATVATFREPPASSRRRRVLLPPGSFAPLWRAAVAQARAEAHSPRGE
ncbi:MAG: hypothetical protein ACJ8GN_15940 [Longimicrobiaceae bacterium]